MVYIMSSSSVDQIKERLGIVDVVSRYLTLEKAGSNLKAKCPFHNEKTPSFFVSPSRNTFYCFGCGVKGDIFTFIEQFEGLDFRGALKVLSEHAGVPLALESRSIRDERTRMYELLAETTSYFERSLKNEEKAQEYLIKRGLTADTSVKFRLGYAKEEWNALHGHLQGMGYSDKEIEKAGLIKLSEHDSISEKQAYKKRYYDRFRGRIMFPIADGSGRIIAFSGRLFPKIDESAKYINSPETVLFNKSRVLYGYDKAKYTIRKSNFSIVVEGQMDLLMSHQAGFPNTVALSGTALTSPQINALRRLSSNIVLAYDADQAGVASSGRSAGLVLSAGMDVKVAAIPSGVDPADLVRMGAGHFKEAIRTSKHIVDFYLDVLKAEGKDDRSYGRAVVDRVLPFVARIANKVDQAHFVGKVARRLNTSEDIVWEELVKIPKHKHDRQETEDDFQHEREMTRKDTIEQKLLGIILWQEGEKKPVIDTGEIRKKIKHILGKESYTKLMEMPKGTHDGILFMAEVEYENAKEFQQDVSELLAHLEKEHLRGHFDQVLQELRHAEQEDNEEVIKVKLEECKKLSDRISALSTV